MIEVLYGRHSVLEVLRANRRSISEIEIAKGIKESAAVGEIIHQAKSRKIPIIEQPRTKLDKSTDHHQGILASCSPYPYIELDQIIEKIRRGSRPTTILLLDIIQNPQNLGTLLRTAEAVGVEGIIVPSRRGVGVTPAVVSASAGASEHMWIAQHNLAQAIKVLKNEDLWIFGMENSSEATRIDELDTPDELALVVGGEGGGLRRLTREACDRLIRLPMKGEIESLNAAVAGSIALYFLWSSRGFSN